MFGQPTPHVIPTENIMTGAYLCLDPARSMVHWIEVMVVVFRRGFLLLDFLNG